MVAKDPFAGAIGVVGWAKPGKHLLHLCCTEGDMTRASSLEPVHSTDIGTRWVCDFMQGRNARQGRAGQGRVGQDRAGQGGAGHGRAGQGRVGQGWADQGRAETRIVRSQ